MNFLISLIFASSTTFASLGSQGIIHGVVVSFDQKQVIVMNHGQKVTVERSKIDPKIKLKAGMSIDVPVDLK